MIQMSKEKVIIDGVEIDVSDVQEEAGSGLKGLDITAEEVLEEEK